MPYSWVVYLLNHKSTSTVIVVRIVPVPVFVFPDLINAMGNTSRAFDPDSSEFLSYLATLEIYTSQTLGRGAMKTCVAGKLTILQGSQANNTYSGPQGVVAVKRPFTAENAHWLTRFPSATEKTKCQMENAQEALQQYLASIKLNLSSFRNDDQFNHTSMLKLLFNAQKIKAEIQELDHLRENFFFSQSSFDTTGNLAKFTEIHDQQNALTDIIVTHPLSPETILAKTQLLNPKALEAYGDLGHLFNDISIHVLAFENVYKQSVEAKSWSKNML
ncbi:hypothetical protein C8R42DRAFT_637392 [Lentinula raphanica]|nr:hypothetical protein C8R42DRAFT_637392 [Lentinula raphanica]